MTVFYNWPFLTWHRFYYRTIRSGGHVAEGVTTKCLVLRPIGLTDPNGRRAQRAVAVGTHGAILRITMSGRACLILIACFAPTVFGRICSIALIELHASACPPEVTLEDVSEEQLPGEDPEAPDGSSPDRGLEPPVVPLQTVQRPTWSLSLYKPVVRVGKALTTRACQRRPMMDRATRVLRESRCVTTSLAVVASLVRSHAPPSHLP